MESSAGHGKQISNVKSPNINGLPDDIAHMLHHSIIDILLMLRSIESANLVAKSGREAAIEGRDLLARLKAGGL